MICSSGGPILFSDFCRWRKRFPQTLTELAFYYVTTGKGHSPRPPTSAIRSKIFVAVITRNKHIKGVPQPLQLQERFD